ncbi:MAG: spermidine synthase [Gemmatimonadota bacterium]
MKPLERLGEARTPDGTVIALYRHDGAYLIRADGVELMSTRRHLSEDRLAEVACGPYRDVAGARVLIGGLGLGFTLRAALRSLGDDAEVVVAEFMAEVIAWNANAEYELSAEAMRDPRVRIVHDDIVNVLQANPGGFDAIMLDTDNGPEGMLMSESARLYAKHGIGLTMAALRGPGPIVYWSVGDDPTFAGALVHGGLAVTSMQVRAHETSGPMHTLYMATPRPPKAAKAPAAATVTASKGKRDARKGRQSAHGRPRHGRRSRED